MALPPRQLKRATVAPSSRASPGRRPVLDVCVACSGSCMHAEALRLSTTEWRESQRRSAGAAGHQAWLPLHQCIPGSSQLLHAFQFPRTCRRLLPPRRPRLWCRQRPRRRQCGAAAASWHARRLPSVVRPQPTLPLSWMASSSGRTWCRDWRNRACPAGQVPHYDQLQSLGRISACAPKHSYDPPGNLCQARDKIEPQRGCAPLHASVLCNSCILVCSIQLSLPPSSALPRPFHAACKPCIAFSPLPLDGWPNPCP